MPTELLRHEHIDINTNIMSTSATQAQTNAKNGLDRHAPLSPTDDDATQMAAQDARTKKVDKKSPEYLMKSMLAGGIAGCAVRRNHFSNPESTGSSTVKKSKCTDASYRPKPSSAPSTVSKSSFKPATPNSQNTRVPGPASPPPCTTSTPLPESAGSSKATPPRSSASSPTPASSSLHTNKSAPG